MTTTNWQQNEDETVRYLKSNYPFGLMGADRYDRQLVAERAENIALAAKYVDPDTQALNVIHMKRAVARFLDDLAQDMKDGALAYRAWLTGEVEETDRVLRAQA